MPINDFINNFDSLKILEAKATNIETIDNKILLEELRLLISKLLKILLIFP